MKKNDTFIIEITDMGVNGEGIGHYEGMTFFIKDAVIGDTVLAKAIKVKKNYGYARVEELLTPSADRVTPPCPVCRPCGGCQIQALSYEAQLRFKLQKVRDALLRIGGFSEELLNHVMEPPVGMEGPFRYRNKAQLPVGADLAGNPVMGFYAAHTHAIIPMDDCLLGIEANAPVLAGVKAWMNQYHISHYDEKTQTGLVRHVLIRYGFATGQLMVCLIINARKLPHADEFCSTLAEINGMTSISYNCNTENTNVILGNETVCIWGQPYITDSIPFYDVQEDVFVPTGRTVTYHISPQSFYQVNPVQTARLYSTAAAYAGLTGQECVWDLYCGIGTISLFLAHQAGQVYGVEVVPQAIADARENASLNGITNVQFYVGKAENVEVQPSTMQPQIALPAPDIIIVDPPRKGCDGRCIETMLRVAPQRIVYVSCDPATLARDLKILCDGGYELTRARVFDQFPQTVHVETVTLLTKCRVVDEDVPGTCK